MNKAVLFASAACIALGAPIHAKFGYYDIAASKPKEAAINKVKDLTRSIMRGASRVAALCTGGYVGCALGFLSIHEPLNKDFNHLLPAFIGASATILITAYDKLEQKILGRKNNESSNTKYYAGSILAGLGLGGALGAGYHYQGR